MRESFLEQFSMLDNCMIDLLVRSIHRLSVRLRLLKLVEYQGFV